MTDMRGHERFWKHRDAETGVSQQKPTRRIPVCPKRIPLHSYSGDGIETVNPTLGVWILRDKMDKFAWESCVCFFLR